MVRKTVKLWEDREIRHFSIKGKKAVRGKWKKKKESERESKHRGRSGGGRRKYKERSPSRQPGFEVRPELQQSIVGEEVKRKSRCGPFVQRLIVMCQKCFIRVKCSVHF